MTYVKGTTTWGNLSNDLTKLICGEKADDFAVTVAATDQWVRCYTRTVTDGVLATTTTVTSATAAFTTADVGSQVIGTGVPLGATIASVTNSTTVILSTAATATATGVTLQISLDTIRTKTSLDVSTGNCSNRTGYFSLVNTSSGNMAIPGSSVCRVTSPFTSDPSSSGFHRWVVAIQVTTANTTSGNYSTARFSWQYYDADSGTLTLQSTNAPLSAAGSGTLNNGLVISITDPSGTVTVGTNFARAFAATYMYGVDTWPMLWREGGTAASFSVAPPGVAGTDYDVVRQPSPQDILFNNVVNVRGNLFYGLGIKTATANTGALYTVLFGMALNKGRIFNSSTSGVLSLDVGDAKVDTVNGNTLRAVGLRVTTWSKMFQTPASVTSTSQVQYFASVKSDGIVLVLNADPGVTGKLGASWFGALTPVEASYDVLQTSFNVNVLDYMTDQTADQVLAVQHAYWGLRRMQDGSEGSRDWQTKWMRGEILARAHNSGANPTDLTAASASPTATATAQLTYLGWATSTLTPGAYPPRHSKPSADGKWWLFGFQMIEGTWTATTVEENRLVRFTNARYYYIPGDSWASGDELTDTTTSTKYLLVTPDYAGIGARLRTGVNTFFGGLAVAEL